MCRVFCVCLLLLWTYAAAAQSLFINGVVVTDNASPEGTKIIIYKNNIKIETLDVPKKGRFDFKLALEADYKVSFEKPGYITKSINVNTEVPSEVLESNPNFPPLKLTINLLPVAEGVDISIFDQPIAILSYNHELDDFTFDSEYSKKIRDRVAQTEQSVRRTLAERGSEALKKEQMFADLCATGERLFTQKEWQEAINSWQQALTIKPDHNETKGRIAAARNEMEAEKKLKETELQREEQYKQLIAKADNLFIQKQYAEAKNLYTEAQKQKEKDTWPPKRIDEINRILSEIARLDADKQKQQTELDAKYQKMIAEGDRLFNAQNYETAIVSFREASALKASENYPKEMITKAGKMLGEQKQMLAAEKAKQQQNEQQRMKMQAEYDRIIAEADAAFKAENYSLARLRYSDADALNLGIEYPKKQIAAIDSIINSSKYKAKLADYNRNKAMAEKELQGKNYASSKFYYQKALTILPIDKENMEKQISEIDRMIEAEQLAAIQKQYDGHIAKADKAFKEKSYAVAKFYYQKALEVKIDDKYASTQLKEVEKFITGRQEKGAEL